MPIKFYSTQIQTVLTPTAGATVTPDPSQNELYSITFPAGNLTIANPLTQQVGQTMTFEFTQDSVGSRTVTWGTAYKTSQQPASTASSVTIMEFRFDGTNWIPSIPLSPQTYTVSFVGVTTTAGSTTMAILDGAYQVASVSAIFTTAGGAGAAVTATVDTGTQAPGAGTAQLTATIALTGTANTVVSGTLIASPTTTAAGNRIAFTTSGTLTGLAGCTVTVTLKRV